MRQMRNVSIILVDERVILEWILRKIGWEGVDWILLAQEIGTSGRFLQTK
jgi:hypothetical protein